MTVKAPLRPTLRTALALLAGLLLAGAAPAQEAPLLTKGQTLYLPVYSHFWHGNLDKAGNPEKSYLSALISLRNTDPKSAIRILSARYYDTGGKLLKEFVPAAKVVPPLATLELFIERKESEGGSGANFIVRWQADGAAPVNTPQVEALHVDMYATRAVSFITTARPIVERE